MCRDSKIKSVYSRLCIFFSMLLIGVMIFAGSFCYAWDNPCYNSTMESKSVPKATRSNVTLESKRVRAIQDDIILYDLGKEMITIRADSLAAKAFIKEVRKGRCHAREPVTLEPETRSPPPAQYKTVLAVPGI
jgi:hypothetical protein